MQISSLNLKILTLAGIFISFSSFSSVYAQVDNSTGMLKLENNIITNDGGNAEPDEWILFASGVDNSNDFSNNGGSGIFEEIILENEYTLSSSSGPDGYFSSGIWNCDGGSFVSPNKITVNPGNGFVTCTITNDDIAPTLKLVKELILDDGGIAIPDDWTLTAVASSPDPVDRNITTLGGKGEFETVYANVRLQLAESNGPTGYTALNNGLWICSLTYPNGDVSQIPFPISAITLNEGDSAICTITNDDDPIEINSLSGAQERAIDHVNTLTTKPNNSPGQDQSKTCEKIQREITKLESKGEKIPAEIQQIFDDKCS